VRDAGAALEWPERASLPVTDLEDIATVRLALGVCAKTLARKLAAKSPAEDGVGRIVLSASASPAGRPWTDEVTARQERGLKHRAYDETRTIPIPRSWSGCSARTSSGSALPRTGGSSRPPGAESCRTPATARSGTRSAGRRSPPPSTGHRSAAAPGTASRSCCRSTRTASRARGPPPTSASPRPSASPAPGKTPVKRATATPGRHPERAVQSGNPGESGPHNRSHRSRPWPFRARPWAGPPSSVDFTAPKSGTHGRIADGGGPKSRLE
jgi:hypothetical protein